MLAPEPARRRILVVDDEPSIRAILACQLHAEGYAVTCVANGPEALAQIKTEAPDLVLLDLDMPYLCGFEVCRRIKSDPRYRFLPVIILTARDESDARVRAYELDADDFLTKPFRGVEVAARCRSLLRVKDLVQELDCAESVLFALARAIEAKSRFTQGHSERVTAYALSLGSRVGLTKTDLQALGRGAALHDIGKLAVPDIILNKPGALTADEYAVIKQHPLEGVRIVESLRSMRDAIPMIRWHHERLDGKGYPDGLFGGAIPLLAHVLAVADVFDALASERPYRPGMPVERCLEVLRMDAAGGGLDPELVRSFCADTPVPLLHATTTPTLAPGAEMRTAGELVV